MDKVLIWDLPTRFFHWLLVLSLLAQYVTAEWLDNAIEWHFYIGYFTLFLIVFRVLWGVVGTQHAKFSSFVKGPKAVFKYATTLFRRDTPPSLGHNPLGGWFVIVMLTLVAVQAVSGLFMTDDVFLDGPYRSLAGDEVLEWMSTVHHLAFDLLLYVIGLHIIAITFYRVYKKQNLVQPMIDGGKETSDAGIFHSRVRLALIVAIIAALIVYVAVEVYPPSPDAGEYYYY